MKHRSAGRASNRAYGEGFRRRVLGLVREKYGGEVGERFGPTLAAEHLRSEDGQEEEVKRHFVCKRWTIERAGESSIETPWFGTHRLDIGMWRFLLR